MSRGKWNLQAQTPKPPGEINHNNCHQISSMRDYLRDACIKTLDTLLNYYDEVDINPNCKFHHIHMDKPFVL